MSNRNYLPVEGRFSTPDPAGLMAADPSNPQTWNLYAYVTNNPLTNTDPTGLGQPPRIIMETPVTGACEIPSNQVQAICQGGWGFPFLGVTSGFSFFGWDALSDNGGFLPVAYGILPGELSLELPWPQLPPGIVGAIGAASTGNWGGVLGSLASGTSQSLWNMVPNPAIMDGANDNTNNDKWCPSYGTNSCQAYDDTGRPELGSICRFFGNSPIADSIRGCLQQYYNPNYSNGTGGYIEPGVPMWTNSFYINPIGGAVGPLTHLYCISEGIFNH